MFMIFPPNWTDIIHSWPEYCTDDIVSFSGHRLCRCVMFICPSLVPLVGQSVAWFLQCIITVCFSPLQAISGLWRDFLIMQIACSNYNFFLDFASIDGPNLIYTMIVAKWWFFNSSSPSLITHQLLALYCEQEFLHIYLLLTWIQNS